jgi:hypothetical protein
MKLAPVAPANNKQVNFIENSLVGKAAHSGGFLPEYKVTWSLFLGPARRPE